MSRGDGGREKGLEGERLRWGLEVWIWRDKGRALRLLGRVEAVGRRTLALRAGVVSVCGGNVRSRARCRRVCARVVTSGSNENVTSVTVFAAAVAVLCFLLDPCPPFGELSLPITVGLFP